MSKQKEWKAIVNRPGIEKWKGENMFTEYIDKKIQDLKNEEMILEKMTIEELKLEVLKDMKQKYMEFNEN